MAELGEAVTGPDMGDDGHPEDCVFCEETPVPLKGYKTKHGALKDEGELEKNLWTDAKTQVTHDSAVGPIHPFAGGGDLTEGWEAAAGVLEDFAVKLGAAPHHLIPGKAAMALSQLEQWTCASKGQIKEDIGYSIDCVGNGIFLPHLPEIYWTKTLEVEVPTADGPETRKIAMSRYYGQTWLGLSESSKQGIGAIIMGETALQMHYTDHSVSYEAGSSLSYDVETKESCDQLSDLMENFHLTCERSRDDDGKRLPPYALVARINKESGYFRGRITGRPDRWKSWVSPLARAYFLALLSGAERLVMKGRVSRKYRGFYGRRNQGVI